MTWLQSPDTSLIWDMKRADNKNRAKKDKLWEDIACQVDKTGKFSKVVSLALNCLAISITSSLPS